VSTVLNRYEFSGYSTDGGDAVASVSISVPSFQGGLDVSTAFIENIRQFFAAQQNVAKVVVTKVETVTTDL
jgi:hypothetical protein